ncbi:MAG TPA: YceI family protein [Bacteroidales bacterium]|nr:YceI family protein [Bacteroidales bacterium]HSA42599.1 YceI family protein [Bacteroidales bacterium]
MKHLIFYAALVLAFSYQAAAQKYITKNGKISFFSSTPIENIEAHNKQVNSALDATTGEFVFKVLMKSFAFEKALMQEHFNENYVESDKFPNATFNGKIVNLSEINFSKAGVYPVTIQGDLTIHGVTKKINEKGTVEVKDGKVNGKAKFYVKPADYNISIPKTVMKNIAESIEVTVDVMLEKLNK